MKHKGQKTQTLVGPTIYEHHQSWKNDQQTISHKQWSHDNQENYFENFINTYKVTKNTRTLEVCITNQEPCFNKLFAITQTLQTTIEHRLHTTHEQHHTYVEHHV